MSSNNNDIVVPFLEQRGIEVYKDSKVTCASVTAFTDSRACEILALQKVLRQERKQPARQMVPNHMRRRAVSYNTKRIPHRLWHIVKEQDSKGATAIKTKRPSRRYRRRPTNLLSEYARRKARVKWLETHLWHAKRFHIKELWGCKIPWTPTDKGIRSSYRASVNHCLMQDISYHHCIQVSGDQSDIITVFAKLTNKQTGLSIGAVRYLSGTTEGSTVLYKCDRFPFHALGSVNFMWKPEMKSDDTMETDQVASAGKRMLWIWIHVAARDQIIEEINAVSKNLTTDGTTGTKLCVQSLEHELCRFRLIGPLSHAVLQDTLSCMEIKPGKSNDSDPAMFDDPEFMKCHTDQSNLWAAMHGATSPAMLNPHSILSLLVYDPRLNMPNKRTKVVSSMAEGCAYDDIDSSQYTDNVSHSLLWDESLRRNVIKMKLTDIEMNKLKSESLVPGTALPHTENAPCVPVILVQRPGYRPLGNSTHRRHLGSLQHCAQTRMPSHGCGWDLILPARWATSFWVALVYRGGRAGGLKECLSASTEAGQMIYPQDYPDTAAGRDAEEQSARDLEQIHSRKPPAKRVHHARIGISSAFQRHWAQLVKEWKSNVECVDTSSTDVDMSDDISVDNFCVLRCVRDLRTLHSLCGDKTADIADKFTSLRCAEYSASCIIPVDLSAYNRGNITERSIICVPTADDLKALNDDSKYAGPMQVPDKSVKLPKKAKKVKKSATDTTAATELDKQLSALIEQTVDGSRTKQTLAGAQTEQSPPNASDPDVNVVAHRVRHSCSRQVMGFVQAGGYRLHGGAGGGHGFISLQALLYTLQGQYQIDMKKHVPRGCLVLVREPSSLQYRFATLTVLL